MVTLTDIVKQSLQELEASFTHDEKEGWQLSEVLSENLVGYAQQLKREYHDFRLVFRLSLASYFLSFLVLFLQKQGLVQTKEIIAIEPLRGLLDHLATIFLAEDNNYELTEKDATDRNVIFLDRWLSGSAPFSAKNAKQNIVLDLLIQYDRLHSTRLSSRLLHDVHYIVYFLSLFDERISRSEKELLDFLADETKKIKDAIGDQSKVDMETYGLQLQSKQSAVLLQEASDELHELIGLHGIKHEIRRLEAFLKIQKRRQELNLAVTGLTLHFVFRGNPGTGKTTVARILGKLFKGLGFLAKGHVEETDRSGLIAEYLGQTAVKTRARAEAALDGILFIDEAYALSREAGGGGNDAYGREAIETILKFMEDNRKRIVVIVAGYPQLMDNFIGTNPGLKSRFTRYLDFDDFKPLELCQIMQLFVKKGQYRFTDEAVSQLAIIFSEAYKQRTSGFGNARFVRNLFEETLQNQAMRLAEKEEGEEQPGKEDLMTLNAGDLPKEIEEMTMPSALVDTIEKLPWCASCDCRQPQCPLEKAI